MQIASERCRLDSSSFFFAYAAGSDACWNDKSHNESQGNKKVIHGISSSEVHLVCSSALVAFLLGMYLLLDTWTTVTTVAQLLYGNFCTLDTKVIAR
jgi:hypothetical protein